MKKLLILFVSTLLLTACVSVNTQDPEAQDATKLDLASSSEKETSPGVPAAKDTMPELDPNLKLTDRTVVMKTNYGTLNIKMLDQLAPKATENFIRLSNQGYYDGIVFHRMVVSPGMKIIQGGDPKGNGTGGESVWGKAFEDETMDPADPTKVRDAEVYADYDGRIATYKKGYLAMANAGPNTNGSQFFVMLDDTKLPPAYTIFGQVAEADYPVLDKILEEVAPDSPMGDGAPDKELKMVKVSVQ